MPRERKPKVSAELRTQSQENPQGLPDFEGAQGANVGANAPRVAGGDVGAVVLLGPTVEITEPPLFASEAPPKAPPAPTSGQGEALGEAEGPEGDSFSHLFPYLVDCQERGGGFPDRASAIEWARTALDPGAVDHVGIYRLVKVVEVVPKTRVRHVPQRRRRAKGAP